ncbi:MAG: response regulator, partial [Lachnospiraceae bacterium]|nr:response regulator [Lachnospiraceae bacterium]
MNLHDILLSVQYITVIVLFIEIVIVFLGWKNSIHSYLFLTCITSFISNLGYLLELQAVTEEAYLTALKLSYAGRIWIVFSFFLFTAKMCSKKLPRVFVYLMVLVDVCVYGTVLNVGRNGLYYKTYSFEQDKGFYYFHHTGGIMYELFMVLSALFIVVGVYWLIKAFRREKGKTSRQRYFTLMAAVVVQAAALFLQMTRILPVSRYYDITMIGALLGTILILVGIFKFDLMGAREIAREFVIDKISEGIIVVDNGGRILYFNEPAARLFPEFHSFYSFKPIPGKAISTPYDVLADITGAIEKNETLNIDGRIYTPEENDLQYRGETYGKLYALVDETEHYRYIEEIQEQKEIADHANEAKSRFLASMSHEIRTPINAVLGMDEMILRESNEKPIRSYAADIMSAGRTLLSLINDILDLSKVEEGKMEIIPARYDLSSLINDLNNMIRDRAQKKGLELNVEVDPETPHLLYGDEIRIRQCIMNILTNAVKYTEKGQVDFRVSYEKKDEDHIFLKVSVKDTGIGMKPEDMESLFSPYKRIEEKRNRYVEGTGLGMSITRQLLDLMGTRLDVESQYGKGSIFSFDLEQKVLKWEKIGDFAARHKELATDSYEYHELFHAPDARILVVDDTEMNLTVIQSLLKCTAIGIDTCMSGKEALAATKDTTYDVIFIDHMMPDMDGIETLKHIRQSGACKDVPAVALTANAVSGAREMYLEAGFDDCLFKPVDGEKLEHLLFEMLPKDKIKEGEFESVDEIDEAAGLTNCGSLEGYINVLSVFRQTTENKAREIEDLYRKKDIEMYTIKVHALKSSARIIGAGQLSGLAKSLEDAGKSGDLDYINANTDKLLSMYRGMGEKLKWLEAGSKD